MFVEKDIEKIKKILDVILVELMKFVVIDYIKGVDKYKYVFLVIFVLDEMIIDLVVGCKVL